MLQHPDKYELMNKQCLLLGEMLSTQAKHTPGLSEHRRFELAIGALLAALKATDVLTGSVVVQWLVSHIKVRM